MRIPALVLILVLCIGGFASAAASLESPPTELAPFFIEKGSVAVDGISLTVNAVLPDRFTVQLIPETQARTTLQGKGVGSRVNLEADMIGKYVARLFSLRQSPSSGLTEEALKAAGFGTKG